jgi:hypothetical protein
VPAPLAQTGADDRVAKRHELARARALWRAHGARDYRFRIVVRCLCPETGMPMTVTVRDGRARGASGFATRLRTVPLMFTRIQSALNDPAAGDVAVAYDRRRGFPRRATIDQTKRALDDEVSWTVDRFKRLPHLPG